MEPKLLTQSAWKTVVQKLKLKDNGLQRALAAYEAADEEDHDELLEAITSISQLAGTLRKSKEVPGGSAVAKYLSELITAAEVRHRDVTKAKAEAGKARVAAQAAEAKLRPKLIEDDVEAGEDEEEEEEELSEKLLAGLHKLRSAKDEAFEFIVCDAKPHWGVMVAKKITSRHKEQLSKHTGSRRFIHVGFCHFKDGKYHFNTERPASGLAHKLQQAFKALTNKKFAIVAGGESAGDEEPSAPGTTELPKLPKPGLATAPQVWLDTRAVLRTNLQALKSAIQARCADESADFLDEVNDNLEKLDRIVERLDHRLADSLTKANAAKDASSRKSELGVAKAILAEYIKYVKSEPLIEHIDANPFGVKTGLKAALAGSLTHLAQSIG